MYWWIEFSIYIPFFFCVRYGEQVDAAFTCMEGGRKVEEDGRILMEALLELSSHRTTVR